MTPQKQFALQTMSSIFNYYDAFRRHAFPGPCKPNCSYKITSWKNKKADGENVQSEYKYALL